MKREYNEISGFKGKEAAPWLNEEAAGNDELLAVLGYKVRSNDMAEVASKIEQLEMAMGTFQDDGATQFSESVHYNPSDLSGWIHSLLTELNPVPEQRFEDNSEYDLRAIPGIAAYRAPSPTPPPPPPQMSPDSTLTTASNKRMKSEPLTPTGSSSSSTSTVSPEKSSGAVVVDSQEAGVRLVHTLMACAESIQGENLTLADALVKQVGRLAVSQSGAMRKVATYYAEALARRIYGIRPHLSAADAAYTNLLQTHFYECTPYLKFAHFTANQALLEAFNGAKRVHVIDFSMNQGLQWPALLQALALRPGGPPSFRLTGVGPPQEDGTDALQEVGWKLARFAETVGVEFHYRGFVCQSLTDLEPGLLNIHEPGLDPEILAVNSVFELHPLLARPGAFDKVLQNIKSMNPKIITVVEQESNHNGAVFVDRFNESLHYYSTMFDSMEGGEAAAHDVLMSEVYLGRQICNVVACEGVDRAERHETLTQWRVRMESAGFDPVHLGSNAFKQASMLLALFAGGDGYTVVENEGCLLLGWHNRSLIATSAWRLP